MRYLALVTVLALLPSFATRGEGDKDAKPITPEAAAKKVNEKCIVEMKVQSVGKGNGVFFLNSREDFKDKDNFTIFVNKAGVESLKEAKIDDPAVHFKDKTVRVAGTVVLYKDRPEIIVEKAEQIQIVEKSKKAP
jgi:DNA/RNA endonuclease YhcR with UshA esterase domain